MSYKTYNRRPNTSRQHSYSARPPRYQRSKENINISRFISAAKPAISASAFIPQHSFEDFNIDKLLLDNLQAKGITSPLPIQDQAIPIGLTGKDIIGTANTGTGKTIAFAIPILQKLITNRGSKALIMAPTRELANQIEEECHAIAVGSGLYSAVLIGGAPIVPQLRDLKYNPQIVIGTPGRIKDHIERGSLNIRGFNIVVLDEVDRMLDMGFVHDMRQILSQISPIRQSFFFSATLDSKVNDLIQEFSNNPITISVKTGITAEGVDQNIVRFGTTSQKIDKLHDLLIGKDITKALVFDDTQRSVERLSKELQSRGFLADAIHGGKSQSQRQRALSKFKSNEVNILVATDVAARGIDVSDITHVINYSTPQTYNDYIHRIGRAGRAGKTGHALTFVAA
ncbi:MAG TPA: DEAD/DEAH box helicase [Patescibacteria group bacterium]|nr:DEAD/DEAH box helicase [Patescibacteria group bacterium]